MSKILFQVEEPGIRLDLYLSKYLTAYSRTQLQKLIKTNRVTVDDVVKRPSYRLEEGEWIQVELPEIPQTPIRIEPQDIPLQVIYEDEDIIIVDKPAGLVVHPGTGNPDGTLVNALVYHFRSLSSVYGPLRPGIVHRLDRDTSGLMVVAKNNAAHVNLSDQFRNRTIGKSYIGITWGTWKEDSGLIDEPIARKRSDPTAFTVAERGRPAQTEFTVKQKWRNFSEVIFNPKTGRTHQIRVHAAFLGHPIFGDEKYGGGKARIKGFIPEVSKRLQKLINSLGRHALHAAELSLSHPVSGERLFFHSDLPDDMRSVIEGLSSYD
ncbi:MAG: RluA family pseudouridine synthase [FCB group bacterium]|nr:RluA family pseudouridine synthase [FCB group bacterium]